MEGGQSSSNGIYSYDQSAKWTYLVISVVGFAFFSIISILGAKEKHFASGIWMVVLGLAVLALYYMVRIIVASTQTVEISDTGVAIRNKENHEIQSLRWAELNRVSEQRQLG